ncbi:MAG: hypothetical protein ACE5JV_02230 [Nitrososphaerales archaeon]
MKNLKTRIVTQMLPSHRYDCLLTVADGDSLLLDGKELLGGGRFRLGIPATSIL